MSEIRMFTRTKVLAAFVTLVLALTSGVAYAGAYATATQRVLPAVHVVPPASSPSPKASASPAVVLGPNHRPLPPLPPMPTGSSHYRKIKSATGACFVIVVSGNTWNSGCTTSNGTDNNSNPSTGTVIQWTASDLPTAGAPTYTDYYALSTNGNATTANLSQPTAAGPYAGPTGTQHSLTLSSSGVYILATLNNATNSWASLAYILVGSPPNVETYTDGTLSTKTQTYTTNSSGGGVTVYVAATVLDTTDTYMVGIEDQLTGACVFTAPSSAQTTITGAPYHLCNLTSSAATGAVPNNNGLINANWAVQLGTSPIPPEGGTYMATIFDQTTGQRVASRLFTIIDGRATASTTRIDLQFSNNGGSTVGQTVTAGPSTRIAYNGRASTVADSAFQNLQIWFNATNLPSASDTYKFVIADPTGNVSYETTVANPGATTLTGNGRDFVVPTESSVPFELAYPGSTWTATIYDSTTSKLVAEQSFQILGYFSRWQWLVPTNSTTLDISSGTSQATSLQITNTADTVFGANNGDPGTYFQFDVATGQSPGNEVTDILMQGPSQSTACDVMNSTTQYYAVTQNANEYGCEATYSDSAGNAWLVTIVRIGPLGPGVYIIQGVATPTGTTTALAPGSSLTLTGLTIDATGCTATTADCQFNSEMIPQDAIDVAAGAPVSQNDVSNQFYVSNGASTTINATLTAGLAGYYDSANTFHSIQDGGYTPRCATGTYANKPCGTAGVAQSILANNQPFTGAASKVVLAFTVTNNTVGAGNGVVYFDLLPPPGFAISSATKDPNSPTAISTVTANGSCVGLPRNTVCVQPSSPILTSGTFYIDFTPPTTSFSYTDVIGTVIQYELSNNYSTNAISMNPTTSSVPTFIGSPTTVDSTALAAYSLNGGLMTAGVTPTTVGTNTTNSLTVNLRNTTAGADPFPDEVDMVAVQFPSQSYISVPASCATVTTVTSGWSCLQAWPSAGVTTYYFGQCPQQDPTMTSVSVPASSTSLGTDSVTVCPFALPNEPYSLAPGSTFTATIPVTANANVTATPITVSTFGHGATTDAWSTPVTSQLSVVASASAGAGFSSITGPGGTLTSTTTGNEPSVTGDYQGTSPNYFDTYVYKVKNTSSVGITSVTIAIPSTDTTGSNGADTAGTIWNVTATPTLVIERTGNANGCTISSYTNPTSGTSAPGSINITCPSGDFVAADTLDVTFTAKTPLKINSTYAFTATVNGSATAVSPNWTDDEDILIGLSATLTVTLNTTPSCGGTQTSPTGFAVSMPTETFNFGQINASKYYYCKDAMFVGVTTDASDPTNWSLYASASGNPSATGAVASATGTATTESTTNELLISTDPGGSTGGTTNVPAASIPCATTSCFTYDNTTYTPISLTGSGTGTRLGDTTNGGTNVNNGTVSFAVNYQVAIGTETVPTTGEQETITYTWIAN